MTERKYRIVHLDDEFNLGVAVCAELRAEGYDAYYIPSKREGLQLIRKYRPDLIISDIRSPDMDGFEFLKALKADPATANIPFIFLTAGSDFSTAREAIKLGADDFVSKPFDRLDLLKSIEHVLKIEAKPDNTINSTSQSTETTPT